MYDYYFFQLSTSKGLIAGDLKYLEEDGTKVNCTRATVSIIMCSCASMPYQTHLCLKRTLLTGFVM